jgi:hypothetical protein
MDTAYIPTKSTRETELFKVGHKSFRIEVKVAEIFGPEDKL